MAHPWDLSDEQFEAIRALQRQAPAPRANDPVWRGLQTLSMIWIDKNADPHIVRLTAIGRNYDAR